MGISSSVNNYGTPWISRGYTRTGSDMFSSTYTKTLTSNVSCPAGSLNIGWMQQMEQLLQLMC